MLQQRAQTNQLEDLSAVIKAIKSSEDTRRAFNRIRPCMNPRTISQLDKLLIPQDDGSLTEVTESNDIFDYLLKRGLHDLSQSEGTPLTSPPIRQHLPTHQWNQAWEDIVDGRIPSYLTSSIPADVHTVLTSLQRKPNIAPIDITISNATLESAFAKCNEKTSSSPSGRHYGHYKSISSKDHNNEWIITIHRLIITFALQHCCPPHRWCRALQIWIEKKPGFPKLDRLRIIQLLEADFNIVLRIIWGRRMVWHAEDNNALEHIPQYGSRPHKTPHSALYLKVLSYDYLRHTRTNAAVFNNDAKGCYDRIIPSFGMASCRRVGLPSNAINLLLLTLSQMQFWVRSAHGVSHGFYGNNASANIPPPPHSPPSITAYHGNIHGMMQGSSSAPSIWLLVHLVIFTALSTRPGGFSATCASGKTTSNRKGEGFVDDTDLWVTSPRPSFDQLEALQTLARHWHSYLTISGGALGIDKCFYYNISWRWTTKAIPIIDNTISNESRVSLINHATSARVPIKQITPTTGLRTLGVRLAPDGNFRDEFTYRLHQTQEVVKNVKKVRLTRFEARLAFERVWWPKIAYPLTVTNFTKTQCSKLQTTFESTFLAMLGINRKMPRDVVHGPTALGGLGHRHIHTEQGCLHVAMLLYHLRQPPSDPCQQMTVVMLSHLAIEFGSSAPVMSQVPINRLDHLDHSFLKTTWRYLLTLKAAITSPSIIPPKPQRVHDAF